MPETAGAFLGRRPSAATTNCAFAVWAFKDWAERDAQSSELQQDMQGTHRQGGRRRRPSSSRRRRCRVPAAACRSPWSSSSTGDADQVFEVAEEIKNKAQASGRFIIVQNSLAFDAPQVTVTIDRDRAAALGLSDQRHRPDADAAGRRRRGLASSTAIPTATTSSRRCRRSIRDNPEKLGQYLRAQRHRRDGAAVGGRQRSRPTPRRPQSSSSTS